MQEEVRTMKIYAVKNDNDSYPNIVDGLLEVSESRPTFSGWWGVTGITSTEILLFMTETECRYRSSF